MTPAGVSPAGVRLAWPDLLDALEERNRRCAALLDARDGDPEPPALPDLDLHADGALPPGQALRARLLLAETERLERLLAARAGRLRTALHYQRAGSTGAR